MPNQSFEKAQRSIYQCIAKGCLNCSLQRPCPALIVIAMRYTQEIAKPSAPGG